MLTLFNTLSRQKEPFKPLIAGKVGVYTCGPTVYDYAHIGNMRTYIFEDILKRTLLKDGYSVKHIMNITDVGHLTSDADEGEDKMEKGARREKKTVWEIADFYIQEFKSNLKMLNILRPSKLVRATDHIKNQIALIQQLERKGFVYETSDGVYYDTSKFANYAKLARLNTSQQREGARVEKNSEKRHPSDFALWKFSPKDSKRQMEWQSPWGKGFPGWHIECSAMSMKYLGDTFDIHASAVDHIPVHHTNELAQSEAATGKPLARFWMHADFLLIDGGKMSKSLGNTYPLKSLIAKGFDPLCFKFFCLGAHYRSKLNFTWESLTAAQKTLKKLCGLISMWDAPKGALPALEQKFKEAMDDDLNTPRALAIIWEIIRSDEPTSAKHAAINRFDAYFGLGFSKIKRLRIPVKILNLIQQRALMRKNKNFSASDTIRKEIEKFGYTIEDTSEGTVVYKS